MTISTISEAAHNVLRTANRLAGCTGVAWMRPADVGMSSEDLGAAIAQLFEAGLVVECEILAGYRRIVIIDREVG